MAALLASSLSFFYEAYDGATPHAESFCYLGITQALLLAHRDDSLPATLGQLGKESVADPGDQFT
jgi:hypothetical protein